MSDFNFANTVGGKLVAELIKEWKNAIEVPNSCLPENFHDNVRGGRTLKRLEELCNKRDKMSPHVKMKKLKDRNIARLAAQLGEGDTNINQSLDWSQNECDEIALNRHEIAMVNGMVSAGIIDADDLEEE